MADDQSPRAEASHRYIPAIDGLRALAALMVVAFHARVVPGGFVGVDVFFVLSAFLITTILAREISESGAIGLSRFYLRRLLRLGPALLFMLATYVVVAPFIWPSHPHLFDAGLAAAYISNYSYALYQSPFYLQHTWSLAVEEQFYLLWPLLLPLLLRTKSPLLWLIAAYIAVIGWRASFAGDWQNYYYRADTRASGLIVGAALALYLPRIAMVPLFAWAGFGAIMLTAAVGKFGATSAAFFPMAEIGAALVVGAAAQGQLGKLERALSNPVAVYLGKLSYGIYLWHYPIAVALRPTLDGAALFFAVLVPSIAMAWLSFVSIERLPKLVAGHMAGAGLKDLSPNGPRP